MAKKIRVTKSKKVAQNIDKAMAGAEPILKVVEGRNDPQLTRVFNHYNYIYDDKQSHAWLLQWMKLEKYPKTSINKVKSAPAWAAGTTAGWIARMAMNGTQFAPDNIKYVDEKIKEVLERQKGQEQETEVEKPVVDVQARIRNKNNQLMELCEEEIIDGWFNDPNVSVYDFLVRHNATPTLVNHMKEYYQPQFDEIHLNDADIKEAFGKKLMPLRKFWTQFFDELERYLNNKKVVKVRKPRTPKEKPISKLLEKIQYQKEFAPLKLVSAEPSGIIGAQQLWIFNTKYNTLTQFVASNVDGFSIKGTTLQNFDPDKSSTKKLRKPDEVLNEVLSAGKVAIKKIMDNIKTTRQNPTGRINKDTIILRIVP